MNSTFSSCSNSGTVTTSGERAGGVAGYAEGGTISGCHSTGNISGAAETGGIIGFGADVTVANCYSAGLISAPGADNVGGIAGSLRVGEGTSGITQCYSTADISGMSYVGGIAGCLYTNSMVSHCYSRGDVSAGGQGAGGIAGIMYGCDISSCYTTGDITGSDHVGGIAGYYTVGSGTNTIQNCIALNSAVAAGSGASYIYRVTALATGNYAWDDMTVLTGSSVYDNDSTFASATSVTCLTLSSCARTSRYGSMKDEVVATGSCVLWNQANRQNGRLESR